MSDDSSVAAFLGDRTSRLIDYTNYDGKTVAVFEVKCSNKWICAVVVISLWSPIINLHLLMPVFSLYMVCIQDSYGTLSSPNTSQHVLFSFFCGVLVPVCYHLSRCASDPSVIGWIFQLILSCTHIFNGKFVFLLTVQVSSGLLVNWHLCRNAYVLLRVIAVKVPLVQTSLWDYFTLITRDQCHSVSLCPS